MDAKYVDALARQLSSRRTVLGGLLVGLILPLDFSARKQGRQRNGNGKGKNQQRVTTQVAPCWRTGACIPGKGANVSRCDLKNYSSPMTLNCTGCNDSRANLRGVQLQGANFTRANLSYACLVDANLDRATCTLICNRCTNPWDGSTHCGGGITLCAPCQASEDCDSSTPLCALSVTNPENGVNTNVAAICGLPAGTGACVTDIPACSS